MAAWTQEEDEKLRALYAENLSMTAIAERMEGRNKNQVLGRLHRLGIAGSPLSPLVAEVAKQFPMATVFELCEAFFAEPDEIKKGLSYAGRTKQHLLGSEQTYRPKIVAAMRAHLQGEAA